MIGRLDRSRMVKNRVFFTKYCIQVLIKSCSERRHS